jgi:hypothetical protein
MNFTMTYTFPIRKAIQFATETHEINQKQKRKGKDQAYITHPLTVGLILAQAGASEEVIVAGILHDTVEDSHPDAKVTIGTIEERFGQRVAKLVRAVTEENKNLSWKERKEQALKHIGNFSKDEVLLKSADMIANTTELLADAEVEGESVFSRFNAPKEDVLLNSIRTMSKLAVRSPESPLRGDLVWNAYQLQMLGTRGFMPKWPAEVIEYHNFNKQRMLICPVCEWEGTADGNCEYYEDLFDVSCPICDKMLLVVSYPLVKNKE